MSASDAIPTASTRARRGEIAAFTGISDRYDEPAAPDARVDGHATAIEAQVGVILAALERGQRRGRPHRRL
jgi:adenylylsulfate kinase-like enzyme